MKKILFIIFFLLNIALSYSQKEANIWYFGKNAGLDFNSGAPVALTDSQMDTDEGSASIADADGNLLFYTDGSTVWNRNHAIMENGTGLLGHFSSSQSAIIIPKPGSDTIYYIFTVMAELLPEGLQYSVVDMSLDGGLGAVTNKNIPLLTPVTEHLTAVLHENGEDYWVIAHKYNSNSFYAYLVSGEGVSSQPVISNSGQPLNGQNLRGYMKASPQGDKLVICTETLTQLFSLNTASGVIHNPKLVTRRPKSYGAEFSPSGEVLYISNFHGFLMQFDVTVNDVASTRRSFEIIGPLSGLQLAPDGKIYLSIASRNALTVITNPDILGTGCGIIEDAVSLDDKTARMGLPPFIQSYFRPKGIKAEGFCLGSGTQFSIDYHGTPDAVSWNFGDGTTSSEFTPVHFYNATGTYVITAIVEKGGQTEVLTKSIIIFLPTVAHQPGDIALCDDNGNGSEVFDLRTLDGLILGTQPAASFTVTYHYTQEDADAGTPYIGNNYTAPIGMSTIFARVKNNSADCIAVTSFNLIVHPKPEPDMEEHYSICEGSTITISAPEGFTGYQWSTGSTTRTITVGAGTYTLTVTKDHGSITCNASKTITVTSSGAAVIKDILTNDWTDNNNSITVIAEGSGDYEFSLDGITYQPGPVFNNLLPGLYTVYVRDRNGCGIVHDETVLLMYPKFFTPNGDGINDTWRIKYSSLEPEMTVHIYDRYGKILHSFTGSATGWDGTKDGRILPSTDYWFIAQRKNGREHKGHFSMIR